MVGEGQHSQTQVLEKEKQNQIYLSLRRTNCEKNELYMVIYLCMARPLKARLIQGERGVGSSCAMVWDLLERPNQPGEDWEMTKETRGTAREVTRG